ncbi:FBW10 protein, partial [Penelope pileata]|nr:FBW10 protein [Penelope pileata]
GGQSPAVSWSPDTYRLVQDGPAVEDASPTASSAHGDLSTLPASLQSLSCVKNKDFIHCLPVHLSQYILGLLDQKSLKACASVSRYWAFLAKEVEKEHVCRKVAQEKIRRLQGLCPRGAVSNYAKIVNVAIPQLNKEGCVTKARGQMSGSRTKNKKKKAENYLQAAYCDLQTDTIQLEERNVFCGSYSIRVLTDRPDQNRVIHYSGGDLVAIGSADQKVRIFSVAAMREVPPLLSGHAGSIKALLLDEKKGFILSTSFDLSIRCWNIYSGACKKIFHGHCGTIICLDLHEKKFVSGARDGMVKVWNLDSGACLKTLKHSGVICVVKMNGTHVVSGCDRGLVKVWHAGTGALLKILEGHLGPVKCLSFDPWHLVSGSTDGYVLGWSMVGDLKRCLTAFRHPKEVLSLELLCLRVISGCADGRIRIFNFLTGSCLKVLMGSYSGDPVSFCVAENRMVINAASSLLMFQFEDAKWDYTLGTDQEMVRRKKQETWPLGRTPARSQQPKGPACQQQKHLLGSTRSYIQEELRDLLVPGNQQPHPFALGQPARACSVTVLANAAQIMSLAPIMLSAVLFLKTDGTSDYGTSVPAHPDRQQEKGLRCALSHYKFLLTVSMLQKSCKPSFVRPTTKHPAATGKAWEPPLHQQRHPEKRQIHTTSLQHKKDQLARLQHARSRSDSLAMKRFSVPFETNMLQLKLKNSLHGPTVSSSIPAPCIVRPKICGGFPQKKAPGGHSEATSLPEDEVPHSGHYTTSELIQSTRAMIAQVKNGAVCRGKKPFCPYAAHPSQTDSEFRLLTGKQKEACDAAAAAQCQANQGKLLEDHQTARKKAWLRKTKGLPTEYFTKEGRVVAPELGFNAFL